MAFPPHYLPEEREEEQRSAQSHDFSSTSLHEDTFETEELSPFAQTQKEQDEAFFSVFPEARRPAPAWNMVAMPSSSVFGQSFAFSYGGQGTAKTWPTESPAESSGSLWAPTTHTFAELAVVRPLYSSRDSSLLPDKHLHYDYSSPQPSYEASSPETTAAPEPPATPMYSSYGQSAYDSPTPQRLDSPVSPEKPFFTSTFSAHPQVPFDSSRASTSNNDYYSRKEEPIMDYLPSPSSPTSDGFPSSSSPSDTSTHYPAFSHHPLHPAARKSRRHTVPVPENQNGRAFFYRLPRAGSNQVPAPQAYARRPPPAPAPSKTEDKKQPTLACFFCRGRKIACGAPEPDNPDRTCNQCSRRKLKCEYPKESRRGMRKKKNGDEAPDAPATPR
ncbi:hypothetical protein BDZ89DRAFT_1078161 [Hymenopellis radicata]|nr:hypothetical protein BDZ89DRAFT_1078161 [Hymenopellis radicata]